MMKPAPIIHVTTDYHKFKILCFNRPVDHMRRIEEYISSNNKLYVHPIIVNKEMEVIDGQHRLAFAKKNNEPIYYVIDEYYSTNDMIEHNLCSTNWFIHDFLKFYKDCDRLENSNEISMNYKAAYEICLKNKIPLSVFIDLFSQGSGATRFVRFRTGRLKMKADILAIADYAQKINQCITAIQCVAPGFKLRKSIYSAVYKVLCCDTCDSTYFEEKIMENPEAIERALKFSQVKDISYILKEDVYNKGKRIGRLEMKV